MIITTTKILRDLDPIDSQEQSRSKLQQHDSEKRKSYCRPSYFRFLVETFLFIGISAIIAEVIPSFATILGLSGSLTKMIVCFLFPAIFYLLTSEKPFLSDPLKWGSVILLIFGSITGLISAVVTIMEYIQLQSEGDI